MSDSLDLFFAAAEQTLRFEYQSGDVTIMEYPYAHDWRTMPYCMVAQTVNDSLLVEWEDGRTQIIADGEVCCIPPHTRHKIAKMNAHSSTSRWSHFNIFLFDSIALFSLLDVPRLFSGEVAQQIGEINAELAALHTASLPTFVYMLKKQSLGFLLATTLAQSSSVSGEISLQTGSLQHVIPVLQYIDEHITESLTREELAHLVCLSPSHFYTLFKKVTGLPPSVYIQNQRLHKAKHLLITTSLSIREVALHVGYNDLFHFSRLFKKYYGLSPSFYRADFSASGHSSI